MDCVLSWMEPHSTRTVCHTQRMHAWPLQPHVSGLSWRQIRNTAKAEKPLQREFHPVCAARVARDETKDVDTARKSSNLQVPSMSAGAVTHTQIGLCASRWL